MLSTASSWVDAHLTDGLMTRGRFLVVSGACELLAGLGNASDRDFLRVIRPSMSVPIGFLVPWANSVTIRGHSRPWGLHLKRIVTALHDIGMRTLPRLA